MSHEIMESPLIEPPNSGAGLSENLHHGVSDAQGRSLTWPRGGSVWAAVSISDKLKEMNPKLENDIGRGPNACSYRREP